MELPLLGSITLDPGKPLQQQLYQTLVNLISEGQLAPGTRLPATRTLAGELGISRNTVSAALEQLRAEGFVISKPGSGFYINRDLPKTGPERLRQHWQYSGESPRLSTYGQRLRQTGKTAVHPNLPFTLGLPDLSAFPVKTWSRVQRRHQDRRALLGYDGFQGFAPLREAIAHYLNASRQVRCHADQILVTQGAQQAISLCSQVLLEDGSEVLVENPGYVGARRAFSARNVSFVPVPVDERGLRTEVLPPETKAPLMYITPTHHYPLGGIMPAAERLKLLDWAVQTRTWLLEDDYDSEFHFTGKPVAALQGMGPHTPVIYMGSFSKTLFPALRLGYLVLPDSLIDPFLAAKHAVGGESPLMQQATTADFMLEGHFVRHLRRMSQLYREKWEHLSTLIDQHLAGAAQPVAESAGMHLVLRIDNVDDEALINDFTAAGFGGTSLSYYYLESRQKETGLTLGFANSQAQHRQQGMTLLSQLIEQQHKKYRK